MVDLTARLVDVEAQALADAVTAAEYAPILQGIQPWRWRLGDDQLDLFEDRERVGQIDVADARLALLSCGAALQHSIVSLTADGWHALVSRLPTGGNPHHLAQIRLDHRIPVHSTAAQHLRTIAVRPTDTGPALYALIDDDKLRSLTTVAESEGARLQVLRPDEVLDLVIAAPAPADAAPWRNLLARSQDRTVRLAVLFGLQDRRLDWLRAGEALSAVWLAATELGLSVQPMRSAGEMKAARAVLRRRMPGRGFPYLLLRIATLH